jgi:hypothetical protein
MEKTLRKFVGPDAYKQMKDEEYRYWQSVAPAERFAETHHHSVEVYRNREPATDGSGLKRFAIRLEQAPR